MRAIALALGLAVGSEVLAAERTRPARRPPLDQDPVAWLRVHAVPLSSAESGSAAEFSPIVDWIGSAPLIAVGDGTHGTREFYTIKQRLIEALASRGDLRLIAFEGGWPEFNRLNAHVQARVAEEPEEILRKDKAYWFWRNEEIASVMRWIRRFNDTHPDRRIEVRGIDFLVYESLVDDILQFLDELDAEAAGEARRLLACSAELRGGYANLPEELKSVCRSKISQVHQALEANRERYAARAGEERVAEVLESARRLVQAESVFAQPLERREELRDLAMADNVERLATAATPQRRLVVWAHNGHVSTSGNVFETNRQIENMGSALRRRFGSDLFAVATTTFAGRFTSINCAGPPTPVPFEIPATEPESHEWIFHQTGFDVMAFPVTSAAWLQKPRRLWLFGTCFGILRHIIVLSGSFDAVLFIDWTTPTRQLSF